MKYQQKNYILATLVLLVGCLLTFSSCEDDPTPCSDGTADCGLYGTCVETDANDFGFFCDCPSPYALDANGDCSVDTSAPATGVEGEPCATNATYDADGDCVCDDNHIPNPDLAGEGCVPCPANSSVIVDSNGEASCTCNDGFTLNSDSTGCVLADFRNAYTGTFCQTDEDCTSGIDPQTLVNYAQVTILMGSGSDDFFLNNLGNQGASANILAELVAGDSTRFNIPFQSVGGGLTIEGLTTGTINFFEATADTTLTIQYTLSDGTAADTCTAILTKNLEPCG